jgi:hypothetical protein
MIAAHSNHFFDLYFFPEKQEKLRADAPDFVYFASSF